MLQCLQLVVQLGLGHSWSADPAAEHLPGTDPAADHLVVPRSKNSSNVVQDHSGHDDRQNVITAQTNAILHGARNLRFSLPFVRSMQFHAEI